MTRGQAHDKLVCDIEVLKASDKLAFLALLAFVHDILVWALDISIVVHCTALEMNYKPVLSGKLVYCGMQVFDTVWVLDSDLNSSNRRGLNSLH